MVGRARGRLHIAIIVAMLALTAQTAINAQIDNDVAFAANGPSKKPASPKSTPTPTLTGAVPTATASAATATQPATATAPAATSTAPATATQPAATATAPAATATQPATATAPAATATLPPATATAPAATATAPATATTVATATPTRTATATATKVATATATSTPVASPTSAPSTGPLVFGVYAGGGTGEGSATTQPSASAVNQRIADLAGGKPVLVHLYTAWSWYSQSALDAQVQQFGGAGLGIVLTVKYSPPAGHDGDVAGYEAFVRTVVGRYANKPGLKSFVIGNEANVGGNPNASDGAFANAQQAVARGVIAAREVTTQLGSPARVGFNFAVTAGNDGTFVQGLASAGGAAFVQSVQFVGIDIYPGIWPAGTGVPYNDMVNGLKKSRTAINSVSDFAAVAMEVLEIGYPTLDEQDQANRLSAFLQAVRDNQSGLKITHFNWFDLWDSNSSSTSIFGHYGLSRSDFTIKPSYNVYKSAIAAS